MEMRNELIETFTTAKCNVFIIDTGIECLNEHIYAIVSIHKFDGSINTRFGNKTQLESIKNTYVRT